MSEMEEPVAYLSNEFSFKGAPGWETYLEEKEPNTIFVRPKWRPIEEAPRDGTAILGSDGKEIYSMIFCSNKWLINHPYCNCFYELFPTLWMPMPAPPKPEKKKHFCGSKNNHTTLAWCEEYDNGRLRVPVYYGQGQAWYAVDYCPFCGEKSPHLKEKDEAVNGNI